MNRMPAISNEVPIGKRIKGAEMLSILTRTRFIPTTFGFWLLNVSMTGQETPGLIGFVTRAVIFTEVVQI